MASFCFASVFTIVLYLLTFAIAYNLKDKAVIQYKEVTDADLKNLVGLADEDYYDYKDAMYQSGQCGPCGRENGGSRARIINGTEAQRNRYPWMAFVLTTRGSRRGQCGGSLIGRNTVLTAGHCVDQNPTLIEVYLGCHDSSGLSRCLKRTGTAKIHPDWNRRLGDVAVVQLTQAVTCSTTIQPICLPTASMTVAPKLAKLIGWGLTQPRPSGQSARNLQEAEMTIQTDSVCSAAAARKRVNYRAPYFICTEDTNQKSGCFGDSGGPLMLKQGSVNYIVGTVHAGPPDCSYPNLFGNVRHYLDFIKSNMQN